MCASVRPSVRTRLENSWTAVLKEPRHELPASARCTPARGEKNAAAARNDSGQRYAVVWALNAAASRPPSGKGPSSPLLGAERRAPFQVLLGLSHLRRACCRRSSDLAPVGGGDSGSQARPLHPLASGTNATAALLTRRQPGGRAAQPPRDSPRRTAEGVAAAPAPSGSPGAQPPTRARPAPLSCSEPPEREFEFP